MDIATAILKFAYNQKSPFRKKDAFDFLNSDTNKVSESSFNVTLSRLVTSGKLIKTGYGIYESCKTKKDKFIYTTTEEERFLANSIAQKFPFTKFCVWRPAVLTSFMQHVPSISTILVDVERIALDSMLSHLQELNLAYQVLLNPSNLECKRYLTNDMILIIRPLISEAPLESNDGITVPSLEKILVDAAGDKELFFAQGAEIYHVFTNAFEQNDINKSRLLRYASRRNRKLLIENILTQVI